jgi:hypothetical protein
VVAAVLVSGRLLVLVFVVVLVLDVWVFGVGYGHFAEAADRARHEWDS